MRRADVVAGGLVGEHRVVERDDGPLVRVVGEHALQPLGLDVVPASGVAGGSDGVRVQRDDPNALVVDVVDGLLHRLVERPGALRAVQGEREAGPPERTQRAAVLVIARGRDARDHPVDPASGVVPLTPLGVVDRGVDEIAGVNDELGVRPVRVGAPDHARPVLFDVVLRVSEIDERERLRLVRRRRELDPLAPVGAVADTVEVLGLGLEIGELDGVERGRQTGPGRHRSVARRRDGDGICLEGRPPHRLGDLCLCAVHRRVGPPRNGLRRGRIPCPREDDPVRHRRRAVNELLGERHRRSREAWPTAEGSATTALATSAPITAVMARPRLRRAPLKRPNISPPLSAIAPSMGPEREFGETPDKYCFGAVNMK